MTEPWRGRVLDEIDAGQEEMVAMLAELVRRPSVSGSDEENDIQQHMLGVFDELGLETDTWAIDLAELSAEPGFPGMEVDRSEAWGLVGRRPGREPGAPSLMFNAHLDVVPPGELDTWVDRDAYSARIRDGELFGRGACDMKGGFVSALLAVRALQRVGVPLRGDLIVASVQAEEDGGMGTYATLRRGWRADACVIPEPTGLDLVPANAGSLTFRLRVPGHATHAARRTSGVSALEKFWPIWSALRDLERRRNTDVDPLVSRWEIAYPLSIGVVRGGEWASTVPDLLIAEGRIGVALGEPAEATRADLEAAVADACADDAWLREHPVEVQWWGGCFESGRLPAGSNLADAVAHAHRSVGGRAQQTWAAPYGSDLRLMTNVGGVPTVHYGPGDVALAHGPNESVPLAEVLTCARTLAVLALEHCGIA